MPRITLNWPIVVLLSVLVICATVLCALKLLPIELLTHGGSFLLGLVFPSEPLATKTVYVGDRRGGGGASSPPTSPPPKLPPIVGAMLVFVAMMVAIGCVRPWTPNDAALVANDTAEQIACANEASTREEGEECQCRVRARYPGPQCDAAASIDDGGSP